MSGMWSNEICTFLECTKSPKYRGILKATNIATNAMKERKKKALQELNIQGLTAHSSKKNQDDQNTVQSGTEQNYVVEEEWGRN
jgi:hypothetical protein